MAVMYRGRNKMILQCFDSRFYTFKVESLVYARTLPVNVKFSTKYKQIKASVDEIGLIEPIVVYINDANDKVILDGHLRVEVLKELGITTAHCLISPVEDTYSYNKRVSRLTIVQAQNMLLKAVESGVSVEKLCAVLGVTPDTLIGKLKISDGIAPEVMALLAEKNVPQTIFSVLKKLKFYKQIEMVNIMISINNFTRKFAMSMLHAVASEHLVAPKKDASRETDIRKNLERLEKEMASVQVETQHLQDEYAENNLRLVIIKNHIERLLANGQVLNWLYDNHQEYLSVLKQISGLDDLNKLGQASVE
ncbi:plasmid partitioning protein RepB C-terminal domain-containing protein [Escherichia coli]|uniref:plasmid partitioning protein RepB C-terminal domain-containing protein n=2 Tax=Escherichia coli TaxID=562 RepID=UPI0028157704|nr:plasmid partitioning protein RepB C-terminal domain-containing protein [Escherichia coli]